MKKSFKAFADEVRGKRAMKRLTQEEVANAIGVTRRAYLAFEQGQTSKFQDKETMIKLCNLLEIDLPTIEEEKPLKFKPKMTCEVNPETQMYKGLMLAGFVEPGDKVTIVIERGD